MNAQNGAEGGDRSDDASNKEAAAPWKPIYPSLVMRRRSVKRGGCCDHPLYG